MPYTVVRKKTPVGQGLATGLSVLPKMMGYPTFTPMGKPATEAASKAVFPIYGAVQTGKNYIVRKALKEPINFLDLTTESRSLLEIPKVNEFLTSPKYTNTYKRMLGYGTTVMAKSNPLLAGHAKEFRGMIDNLPPDIIAKMSEVTADITAMGGIHGLSNKAKQQVSRMIGERVRESIPPQLIQTQYGAEGLKKWQSLPDLYEALGSRKSWWRLIKDIGTKVKTGVTPTLKQPAITSRMAVRGGIVKIGKSKINTQLLDNFKTMIGQGADPGSAAGMVLRGEKFGIDVLKQAYEKYFGEKMPEPKTEALPKLKPAQLRKRIKSAGTAEDIDAIIGELEDFQTGATKLQKKSLQSLMQSALRRRASVTAPKIDIGVDKPKSFDEVFIKPTYKTGLEDIAKGANIPEHTVKDGQVIGVEKERLEWIIRTWGSAKTDAKAVLKQATPAQRAAVMKAVRKIKPGMKKPDLDGGVPGVAEDVPGVSADSYEEVDAIAEAAKASKPKITKKFKVVKKAEPVPGVREPLSIEQIEKAEDRLQELYVEMESAGVAQDLMQQMKDQGIYMKPYAKGKELEEFKGHVPKHLRRKDGMAPDVAAQAMGFEDDRALYYALDRTAADRAAAKATAAEAKDIRKELKDPTVKATRAEEAMRAFNEEIAILDAGVTNADPEGQFKILDSIEKRLAQEPESWKREIYRDLLLKHNKKVTQAVGKKVKKVFGGILADDFITLGMLMEYTGEIKRWTGSLDNIGALSKKLDTLVGVKPEDAMATWVELHPMIKNPEIAAEYEELMKQESGIRKSELKTTDGGDPMSNVMRLKTYEKFMDIRFAMGNLQVRTGLPFYKIYTDLTKAYATKMREFEKIGGELYEKIPDESVSRTHQEVIAKYFEAKYKGEKPPQLTEFEKKLADNIQKTMDRFKPLVKKMRYYQWLESKLAGENKGKGFTDMKGVGQDTLEEGLTVFQADGPSALSQWLDKQSFGVIEEGYLPRVILTGQRAEVKTYKVGSFSSKMLKVREAEEDFSNVPLLKRVDSYINKMLNLKYMVESIKKLDSLFEALSQGNHLYTGHKGTLDMTRDWAGLLKGHQKAQSPESIIAYKASRWLFRTITVKPFLWLRNFFQRYVSTPFKTPIVHKPIMAGRPSLRPSQALKDIPKKRLNDTDLEYYDTNVSQLEELRRYYLLFGEQETNKLAEKFANMAETVGRVYPLTDESNRLSVFIKTLEWDKGWLDKYQAGQIPLKKLLEKVGYNLLKEPYEQEHFLGLLDKDPEGAVRWLAKWNVDNGQWLYKPTERSLAEISSENRAFYNLFVWFKGITQNIGNNFSKAFHGRTPSSKAAGLISALGTLVAAEWADRTLTKVTRGRRSRFSGYNITAMFTWAFGGAVGSVASDTLEAASEMVYAYVYEQNPRKRQRAVEQAAMKFEAAPKVFVPFLTPTLNIMEAITDKSYISPLRMIVSRRARKKWSMTKVERTPLERILHGAFGKVYPSRERTVAAARRSLQLPVTPSKQGGWSVNKVGQAKSGWKVK